MKLRVVAILTAILVIGSLGARSAWAVPLLAPRIPQTPLLISVRQGQGYTGNIWSWAGSGLTRRAGGGLCYSPIASPTGDSFVYLQIPVESARQSAANEDRPAPRDVYLATLATGRVTAIALQAKAASYAAGHAHYTLRSDPNWSLDGTRLAWTEVDFDEAVPTTSQDERLVVYDLASKKAKTLIARLPPHRIAGNYPALSEVSLGPGGLIAVRVHVSQDVDLTTQDWLYFYDSTGEPLARRDKLETVDPNYENSQLIWLSGLDKPYLSCIACTTRIDPFTGSADPLNGTPELYSALAPDKLSLYYSADTGQESNVSWVVASNGKQVFSFDSVRIANLRDAAISPDGTQVAAATYVGQGTTAGVFIFQAQTRRAVKLTLNVIGLSWGPRAWRVRSNPAQ